MIVACRTGVPPDAWLNDTRALFTAQELLHEADEHAKRRR